MVFFLRREDNLKSNNYCTYDAAFRAEALRLVEPSRSIQAAAQALIIDPKCIYQW